MIFFLSLLLSISFSKTYDPLPECEEQFLRRKFHISDDCNLRCSTTLWDNFNDDLCQVYCDKLCKKHVGKKEKLKNPDKTIYNSIGDLAKLYPKLSDSEIKIVQGDPKKAWEAYKLSWKADNICGELYKSSDGDDESDACRHFMWSSLLVKDLGKSYAQKLLNAHEEEIEIEERHKMDKANNEVGMKSAEKLLKMNKFNDEELVKAFKKSLEKNEMIILKKEKK